MYAAKLHFSVGCPLVDARGSASHVSATQHCTYWRAHRPRVVGLSSLGKGDVLLLLSTIMLQGVMHPARRCLDMHSTENSIQHCTVARAA